MNHLILFESQARGDAEPDSDIDLLVILEGQVDPWTENQRTGQLISDSPLQRSELMQPMQPQGDCPYLPYNVESL